MATRRGRKADPTPGRIARVAARRVFHKPGTSKQRVTLTIGVPRRVPGSDWGCLVQITGLGRSRSRPRFVYGIDGLQALYLAIQFAGAELETCGCRLEWLGQTDDLGFPRFLPYLPKPDRERLERVIDRESTRAYAAAERRAARNAGRRHLINER